MKTTAKRSTVLDAIKSVNEKHGYEIILNRDDQNGKYFNFTIRSKHSGVPGSRLSWSGRKLVYASWHAHGYLFDEIFHTEPEAVIYSAGEKITKYFGNWQDRNIGSIIQPCYFSETSIL